MDNFLLASDISIVPGAKNILLIDYRNHSYLSLERDVGEFLQGRLIVLNDLSTDDKELVDYLVKNDYGILCQDKEAERFEKITEQWDYPATLSNAIIEIEPNQTHLKTLFDSLSNMNCEHLELRVNKDLDESAMYNVFQLMNTSGVFTIELVIAYNDWINPRFVGKVNDAFNLYLTKIIVHSVPLNFKTVEEYSTAIFVYENRALSCLDCGKIDPKNFVPSIPFAMEGLAHNNCLNRKIGIAANGDIKNCPSMKTTYGNVNLNLIEGIIKKQDFQELWHITKDQIEVCKDCEFRTICMDCRAFVKDSENQFSKPLKCGYDPYKGIWGDCTVGEAAQIRTDFYKEQFSD
jgi:SPASM domain peptide maturase of grasp-with-spasm system